MTLAEQIAGVLASAIWSFGITLIISYGLQKTIGLNIIFDDLKLNYD